MKRILFVISLILLMVPVSSMGCSLVSSCNISYPHSHRAQPVYQPVYQPQQQVVVVQQQRRPDVLDVINTAAIVYTTIDSHKYYRGDYRPSHGGHGGHYKQPRHHGGGHGGHWKHPARRHHR